MIAHIAPQRASFRIIHIYSTPTHQLVALALDSGTGYHAVLVTGGVRCHAQILRPSRKGCSRDRRRWIKCGQLPWLSRGYFYDSDRVLSVSVGNKPIQHDRTTRCRRAPCRGAVIECKLVGRALANTYIHRDINMPCILQQQIIHSHQFPFHSLAWPCCQRQYQ